MVKFGKWLGGSLGWALGGPVGALVGFAIGSLFDTAEITSVEETQERTYTDNQRRSHHRFDTGPGDFSVSLIVLSAAVINADGKVLKSEIEFVKAFLIKQFGLEKTKQLMLLLRDLLQKQIIVPDVCLQIRRHMDYATRLQLMHYLIAVCNADTELSQNELRVLEQIASHLHINMNDIQSLNAMFKQDENADYTILEIEKNCNDDEVKKAYRRMAIKYHPDKVSHLGEEHQKAANGKFQRMQQAYENIKKRRGIA